MIGRDYQDVYVTACGQVCNTRTQGIDHERTCPECNHVERAEQDRMDELFTYGPQDA